MDSSVLPPPANILALCAAEEHFGSVAVKLRAVSKSYRRGDCNTPVLNSVDLSIHRGECVFLLGPSGSGKTTLLSIIGCVLTPDSGSVQLLGQDVTQLAPRQLSRLHRDQLGFVFQRFHLIRGLNALENVGVPLTLAGWPPRDAEARARDLIQQVGLTDQATCDPRRLSVGQCQRVAIARALAANPALVLADEPTAALDANSGRRVMELLRRLTVDVGKTVVIVTHDHRILPYADRVVRIEQGNFREDSKIDASAIESEEEDAGGAPSNPPAAWSLAVPIALASV